MDTAMLSSWWTWLLLPASGAAEHHLPAWAAWHGRLMVLAWAFLLPLGVLAARFFKVVPGQRWPDELDHKAWWHAHRLLQSAGMAAMLAGLWLAWGRGTGAGALAQWHHVLGMAVVVLGLLQTLGGLARGSKGGPTAREGLRGDHYDMTRHRRVFERLHKVVGYAALLLAAAVVVLGLRLADAPRWMWLVIGGWWCAWCMVFVALQRQGRCIDTYQAIWGDDPAHPGQHLPPIGPGIRRYDRDSFARRFGRPPF